MEWILLLLIVFVIVWAISAFINANEYAECNDSAVETFIILCPIINTIHVIRLIGKNKSNFWNEFKEKF